ncbi:Concanavalin A-like lectin glucanases superfamily protein [Rutstroemia sp. NJR-2017a BVV2]|nr:Concanavalin A-like lectin glucanases superfamily protein [Rutstroemia sp. NJR-2017a BVV2]
MNALAATALAAPSRDLMARAHRRSREPQSLQNIQAQGQGQGSFYGFPPEVAGPSNSIIPEVAAATNPSKAVVSISSSAPATSSTSAPSSTSTHASTTSNLSYHDVYSSNWAGAVIKGGATYTGVYAEFTVPTPKKPTVGETSAEIWAVSSWVGIDGFNPRRKCDGLWQAGVDANIDSKGVLWYDAWYEWFPASTISIDLDIMVGDIIAVNLTRLSSTSGSVTMSNLSTGESFTTTATSNAKLCGATAEWIMEDLRFDSATFGLADFGNVTFRNAVAYTTHGTVGPRKAVIMEIGDAAGEILTSSVADKDEVVVTYV